jgi:hypothetical protein
LIGLAIFSMQRRRYRAEGGRVDPVGYLREVLSPQEVGRRLAFVDKATRKPAAMQSSSALDPTMRRYSQR